MSKYEPLWKYLKESNKENYKLSYGEIKNILGFNIDHSFLNYKKESKEYGYKVGNYLVTCKIFHLFLIQNKMK